MGYVKSIPAIDMSSVLRELAKRKGPLDKASTAVAHPTIVHTVRFMVTIYAIKLRYRSYSGEK
jgi:hypothetical protein